MAHSASDHQPGDMDIGEQQKTFHFFVAMTKWGSLYLGAVLVLLVFWFCTSAGFWPGAISAAVLIVLGTLLLRDKPHQAH